MNREQGLEFLSKLVDKINNQDNRCTAMPYFYVIKTQKWRVAKEGYGHGETRTCRVDFDGDPTPFYSKEEFVKWYLEHHNELTPPTPLDEFERTDPQAVECFSREAADYDANLSAPTVKAEERWEELKEFEEEKYDEEDNVFLTEEGYKEHVRLNGHNLGRKGEYCSYVKHAFRNPEMENLLLAIAAVTGKELGKK